MKRLLLIDFSAIFWRNWHATKDQELGSAFELTIGKIRQLASSSYDGVAVCCDAPPYFRKQISPAYKSQRDKPEPAAIDQLNRVIDRLAADGFPLWKSPGYEADDVIASACAWAVAGGHAAHVASADKDLMSLVCDAVQVISTATGEIYDTARVLEKFGVNPSQMPDYLALVGDKSDNVQGVAGVGPVKARDLVRDYESVPQLLAAIGGGAIVGTPAIHAALRDAHESGSLELALRLVTLHTDAPGIDWSTAFLPREERPLSNTEVTDADFEPDPKPEEAKPAQPAEPPAAPNVAIVAAQPASYVTALEPRTMREAWSLSRMSVESRAFSGVANAETACAMILRGRALGIDAVTSLTAFHVIEGKLALSANLIEGMVMRSPLCEYFMCAESTASKCVWVTKRVGYPREQTHVWTIEDARQLGLMRQTRSGKASQWETQPRTMLRHRCGTDLARMVYADVIAGLYAIEELD